MPENNILTGLPVHAEKNIINAMLPEGTTFVRWESPWHPAIIPAHARAARPSSEELSREPKEIIADQRR